VVEVFVPPLRKRPEDIIELASHFLEQYSEETGRKIRGFTPPALQAMQQYRWPGNVRELKNVIERGVLLTQGEYLDVDDLTLSNLATASESGEYMISRDVYEPLPLSEIERRHIDATLKSTGWNKSKAADILGIERSTLDRKIRRYELKRDAK
jgi:Nif-specific regulatory protein